jgi:hypothetical protein
VFHPKFPHMGGQLTKRNKSYAKLGGGWNPPVERWDGHAEGQGTSRGGIPLASNSFADSILLSASAAYGPLCGQLLGGFKAVRINA